MVKSKSMITFEETPSNNEGVLIVEGRGVILFLFVMRTGIIFGDRTLYPIPYMSFGRRVKRTKPCVWSLHSADWA